MTSAAEGVLGWDGLVAAERILDWDGLVAAEGVLDWDGFVAAEGVLDWDGLVAAEGVLDWAGLVNGRDLAGLAVAGRGRIARGRLVRSASPHRGVDEIVADHWRSFDRAEPIEVACGVQPSPRPPQVPADRHQSMGGLLADHPGARCFADPDRAAVVRARLLGRLTA